MSDQIVETIKQRLDLVEFIGEYVRLKPAGKYHKALCPIHHEKTPSFMVDRANGIWHCFGCGKGGDVFSFVQELEGLDFPEALRLLAKRANVPLPQYDPTAQNERSKLAEILRLATSFYHQVLLRSNAAAGAREYVKSRQLTDETIETFNIGYAPDQWDALSLALRGKGFIDADIFAAGLTVQKERGTGYYDRFRNRLMFPISDAHGTVVGFGGRILPPAPEDSAKYINSPQTALYNKSAILYGMDKARQAIRKTDRVIVVEGYLDVITSHQAGIENVVASSGTAFTLDQLRLVKRYTSNLSIAFDADLAGQSATSRGIDLALQEQFDVSIITLPDAKDPDELIRRDPQLWMKAIGASERIIEYEFKKTLAGLDMRDVRAKKRVAAALLPVIAKIGNPIEQTHYLQKLAELLNVSESILRESITRPGKRPVTPAKAGQTPSVNRDWRLSQHALALLLSYPELIPEVNETLRPENLVSPFDGLYRAIQTQYSDGQSFSVEDFSTKLKATAPDLSQEIPLLLLLSEQQFPDATASQLKSELATTVRYLIERSLERTLAGLREELRAAEAAHDTARIDALTERFTQVTEQRNRLSQ